MSNQQTLQELKINGVTYIKLDKIGEGAQGIVYKGKNTQTNEIVAIKEYNQIYQNELKALQRLQNEKFKYIIEIKEVFQDENSQTIIIMELADGTFNEYMEINEYRQLGYDQKNKYFIQIAKGVDQLHKLGLFHRDLKPQNFVYINKPKNKKLIKLIDFGQARYTDIADIRKTLSVGTPQYRAPEIVKGEYDNQIDIWSLGLIWWEMLTNETFFGITKKDKDLKFSQQKIYNKINSSKFIQEKENNFLKNMINLDASKRISLKEIIFAYKKYNAQQLNLYKINQSVYSIINQIGQGNECIVYKGKNTQTNEIVAIKEYQQINQNELKAIQAVFKNNFSHIIKIKAVQQHQNWSFVIVMEYADGIFNKFMQTQEYQRLGYNQKNEYFLQMLQGVDQLHNLGLFHRNLNPESFAYIDQPNNQKIIKLIDFGFVKETSTNLIKTACVGTTNYIAPEVISNFKSFYDKSVDIWSLGIIWYEILTGDTIFYGNNQQEVLNEIQKSNQQDINQKINKNPNILKKEKDLITKMLQKQSKFRIQLKDIIAVYNQNFYQHNQQRFPNQYIQNLIQNQIQQQQIDPQDVEIYKKELEERDQKKQEETEQIQQELKKNMKEDYIQRITDFEQQKELELKQIKREIEKLKEKELVANVYRIQEKQRFEFDEQLGLKKIELKKQYQNQQAQQQEIDIQKSAQMKISSEILFQNEMNQFKKKKEDEQQQQIKQYKQKMKQEKDEDIKQKLEAQEKLIKEQLEMDIQNKYLLEYSNKVTELEKKFQQEYQKQLEEKKQSLLILLQSQQNTISMFIQNLNQKQDDISKNDSQDTKKKELMDFIAHELQKSTQKLKENEQKQLQIQQVHQQEQLKGQDNQITLEILQDQQEQNNVINIINDLLHNQKGNYQNKIKQQQKSKEQILQLEKGKQQFQLQFNKLQQQVISFQGNIQTFEEKIKFYEKVQFQIQEQEKLQEVIGQFYKMIQELQVLQQQEKMINQLWQTQQVMSYQSLLSKVEELQQGQINLKILIEQQNQYIDEIDNKFIDVHQIQIDELAKNLNDQQDNFRYLIKKNQKYKNNIDQIIIKIGNCFNQLKYLNELLRKGIFQNYQQIIKIIDSINQDLLEFQKQHDQLHEQIYQDYQIEQLNIERKKKLTNIEAQLKEFIGKMIKLQNEINNLIQNEYCNNEQTRNLIIDKQSKIDESINQIQEQFKNFQELNQFTYYEIKYQITSLEQFQEKLKKQLEEEQEQVIQLQLIIQQIGAENKKGLEKDFSQLTNQLQQRLIQFSKALQSVNIEQDQIQYYKKMNKTRQDLQNKLQQEIKTLWEYFNINQENQKLIDENLYYFKNTQGSFQQLTMKFEQLQNYNCNKAKKLEEVLISVRNKSNEIKFYSNNLIDIYEQLKSQEYQLQLNINKINLSEQNQKLLPSSFDKLKMEIQNLTTKIDQLIQEIPQDNQIQQFKSEFTINVESYEKLYALVNYIMQYHLTRYYQVINKDELKKQYSQNGIQMYNAYKNVFQYKINEQMEENTQKEKEAQDLLMIYENILFNDYNNKIIDELESDYDKIKKQIEVQENYIKQKKLVKLRACIKDQKIITEIINDKQYYKITEFTQMIICEIISKQKSECRKGNIY